MKNVTRSRLVIKLVNLQFHQIVALDDDWLANGHR
jgi:hypothetical protein